MPFATMRLLSGVDDPRWPLLDEVLAFLLLGNLAVVVMEYETDVPQFSEAFYLPVAVTAALLAAWFARRMTGHKYAVTFMVVGYLIVRLAITGALSMLGRSAPDLPIALRGVAGNGPPVLAYGDAALCRGRGRRDRAGSGGGDA